MVVFQCRSSVVSWAACSHCFMCNKVREIALDVPGSGVASQKGSPLKEVAVIARGERFTRLLVLVK